MGITAELCEKIVATSWNDLDEEAIHRTRRIILDGIAVAVAGTIQEKAPEVLAKHVKKLGGTPDSTVINFRFKTSPVEAAYVNGAAMHVLDFEPMWQPANHQVSTTSHSRTRRTAEIKRQRLHDRNGKRHRNHGLDPRSLRSKRHQDCTISSTRSRRPSWLRGRVKSYDRPRR